MIAPASPTNCRVGETPPPAAAPTRRDRAALRSGRLRPVEAAALTAIALGTPLASWQVALIEHPGSLLGIPRRVPRHRLPDVLPASLDRDLAAHDFSLSSYLDRSVTR